MINKVHFGRRIAALRKRQNLSQSDLSEKLGVPVVPISALRKTGIKELMQRAAAAGRRSGTTLIGGALAAKISEAQNFLKQPQLFPLEKQPSL